MKSRSKGIAWEDRRHSCKWTQDQLLPCIPVAILVVAINSYPSVVATHDQAL